MTIDEMIELAKTRNKICLNHSAEYRSGLFINAEESEQLVRWLEELKLLREKLPQGHISWDAGYTQGIKECLEIVKFHSNEYDSICWAEKEIEEKIKG